jgi:hypothetical protein
MVQKKVLRNTVKLLVVGSIAVAAAIGMILVLTGCTKGETGTIEGTWAGVLLYTYYCEGGAETIQLDIEGSTITITGGTISDYPFSPGTDGTIVQQTGQAQAYNVVLNQDGSILGQLFVDPTINFALLVLYQSPTVSRGFVGILQKGELTSTTYDESDLLGDWAGVAVRVNNDLEVTESSESTATITAPDGLELNGTDGDGAFSALAQGIAIVPVYGSGAGAYVSGDTDIGVNQVSWDGDFYEALYALSYDKTILAVAFIKGLCNFTIFDDLPSQKFALWIKQ